MNSNRYDLATNAGTGASTDFLFEGGKGTLYVEATFSGGNIALQTKTPNGTWVPVANSAGTAIAPTVAGAYFFELAPGRIRVNVTTSTAVYATVVQW